MADTGCRPCARENALPLGNRLDQAGCAVDAGNGDAVADGEEIALPALLLQPSANLADKVAFTGSNREETALSLDDQTV